MKQTYHYTYRITNIKLNKHYYGVRTCHNIKPKEDIGIYYFSSSQDKEFMKDQKDNPQDYKYKVIKTFAARKEASLMEINLHSKFNVRINENFYNKTNAISSGFDATGIDRKGAKNSMYGRSHSKETIKKMKINHKGMSNKKHSTNTKELMKISNGGSSNGNSKFIYIYSNDDKLKFTCKGNFKKICDENNLPYSQLMKSYKNNSFPILENLDKSTKTRLLKMNRFQFKGWYASKMPL